MGILIPVSFPVHINTSIISGSPEEQATYLIFPGQLQGCRLAFNNGTYPFFYTTNLQVFGVDFGLGSYLGPYVNTIFYVSKGTRSPFFTEDIADFALQLNLQFSKKWVISYDIFEYAPVSAFWDWFTVEYGPTEYASRVSLSWLHKHKKHIITIKPTFQYNHGSRRAEINLLLGSYAF